MKLRRKVYIHETKIEEGCREGKKDWKPTKYNILDNGVQCSTFRNVSKDLEKELDVLYCEKDVGVNLL